MGVIESIQFQSFFSEVLKGLTDKNLRTAKKVILRMSVISAQITDMEVSVSEQAAPIAQVPVLTANEVSGYRTCMSQEDAIQQCLVTISENGRNRILGVSRTQYLF